MIYRIYFYLVSADNKQRKAMVRHVKANNDIHAKQGICAAYPNARIRKIVSLKK